MIRFVLRRLVGSVPTLFGVTLFAFFLIRLVPGDPVQVLIGERGASPEIQAEMRAKLGLDKPLISQYGLFVTNIFKGNLGHSIISKQPVMEEFWDRFPATLELGVTALSIAIFFGIPMGIVAALKRNSFWDFSLMGASLVGYSMPIFWWGLILILVFSVHLGLTPVSGRLSVMYDFEVVTGFFLIDSWFAEDAWGAFKSSVSHLVLPAMALATIPLAVIARMTRSSMLEVIEQDYIRTAKAKGVGFRRLIFSHALRNALVPIITVIGLMAGTLITGAILTETIFSWPGIGRWLVQSVSARDYPVIQGGIVVIATFVISINAAVDWAYALANPKIREEM